MSEPLFVEDFLNIDQNFRLEASWRRKIYDKYMDFRLEEIGCRKIQYCMADILTNYTSLSKIRGLSECFIDKAALLCSAAVENPSHIHEILRYSMQ